MKPFRLVAMAALVLMLAGCLFTPGKFDASLNVRKDGSFTYRYVGEIQLITGHSMFAAAQAAGTDETFDADNQVCWAEGSSGEGGNPDPGMTVDQATAECTPAQIEEKRREWEQGRAERAEAKRKETEQMKAMLGGMDPGDPATMTEFARRLQGNGGWRKVTHKGNGLFEVEYEVTSRLDHDFTFPVFDDVDLLIPFVQLTRRSGNRVHLAAPALLGPGDKSGFPGMPGFGAGQGSQDWPFRSPEGTLTLTTDAAILTNNTREGPTGASAARVLKWTIGPLDRAKPEALLQLTG